MYYTQYNVNNSVDTERVPLALKATTDMIKHTHKRNGTLGPWKTHSWDKRFDVSDSFIE